jgi:hypothetical protein
MVASFAWSNVRDPRLRKIVALGALALACTSHEDFFKEPANLAGRAGAATGTGGKETTGQGGASGANGSTGGTSGRGAGAMSGDGGTSAQTGGGSQGGSAGVGAMAGTSPGAGAPGAGGQGTSGSGMGGREPTAGDTSAESGAAGEHGTAGEPGSGGTGGEPCVGEVERCDGVSNDCDELIDEGDVCPVGCEAKLREGRLYLLCLFEDPDDQLAYNDAAKACGNAGTKLDLELELTRLDSAPENTFMKEWIDASVTGLGLVWHGANDLDEERRWVWGRVPNEVPFFTASRMGGGTPVMDRFNDFAPNRPNATNGAEENCGSFDSEFDWQWNDLVCSVPRLGFACEEAP